jgi:hypothetical protein
MGHICLRKLLIANENPYTSLVSQIVKTCKVIWVSQLSRIL